MSNSTIIPAFLVPLLQIIAPQPCFTTLFISYNLLHAGCLKVVLSKCLGFGIIAGSCIVKLPQVIKILRSKSGEGISIPAVTLELAAITGSLSYGFAHEFPFSAYGEAGFLAFQTAIIAFLVLLFGGQTVSGLGYIGVYGGILAYLMSPSVSMSLLAGLQTSGAGIIAISKMIQAYSNFNNGSTGQLSAVTVFLLFFGSLARIFTSIQETGDKLVIFQYVVSTAFNGLIVAQMIYYWNSSSSKSKSKSKKAKSKKTQ